MKDTWERGARQEKLRLEKLLGPDPRCTLEVGKIQGFSKRIFRSQ